MPSDPPSQAEWLAFERLLADLSSRFANLPGDQVEAEIEGALRRLLDFLGYDRSTFAEFTDDGWLTVICSAAIDGVEPFPLGPMPRAFGWYVGEARAGNTIIIQSLDDLPPEAAHTVEYFHRSGLRSHIGIPVRIGGHVTSGVGFAAFRSTRAWPDDLIARLRIIAEVFAQAHARKRADLELAAATAEIKRLKDRIEQENAYLRSSVRTGLPQGLVSRSQRFRAAIEEAEQVAPTAATVLLLGETGAGKEVLAHAIHDGSPRRGRAMVRVNCAALPATLIEAELFGREKGAYTGALARHAGRFEVANGSTIFLDEIGELPLELQPKLLRVLQDGTFERVGGTQTIKVDVRVIAATNRDIAHAVGEGKFREDLFYRLNVFPIEVPPLRQRAEDIPLLSWTFVKEFSKSMGRSIERIADDSMAAMQAYPWPGNVRELRNVIERSMILARGPILTVTLGRTSLPLPPGAMQERTLRESERASILQALERSGWRIRGAGGAAALLDVKPTTLEARMKKLGLTRLR